MHHLRTRWSLRGQDHKFTLNLSTRIVQRWSVESKMHFRCMSQVYVSEYLIIGVLSAIKIEDLEPQVDKVVFSASQDSSGET